MSVEENAKKIKQFMLDHDLKGKDVAEIIGKSAEWVSKLVSPKNLEKHQINALETLKNHFKD